MKTTIDLFSKLGFEVKHLHCGGYFSVLLTHPENPGYWLLFLASLMHVMHE